ncbi:protein SRG1-like [Mangifera indica]|uniref:protein SRG1-like n=1 Tax=Mangifera indica TaxID=29780 RepID=UPI001CFB5FEE|nr:protein SRG1-like [Mangifera indica]
MEKHVWSSLPVPCVQELAKEAHTTIPPRYVRTDLDPPLTADATFLPQLPVIDLQKLLSGDLTGSELDNLHIACKEWGFFQLINHGVSSSLVEKLKTETQEFFNLPMEEKKKYWQKEGDVEGFGQAFVVSREQKLNWGDMFLVTALPIHLRKPQLFSKLPLPFRETLETYSFELRDLAMKILNQMAKALRMESEYVKELFEEGKQAIRVNYYPPCPQPELAMGIHPHSDGGGLTILLQLNEVEGLQIKKDGMWVPVKPLPGAFIINIGNILEIVTNGIYQSIEHRATVNSMKERLSIATIYSPSLDGNIGPAPSLITPETPALFKTISAADYFKGFFSQQQKGKSYLDVMRVQNENGSV